MANEVRLIDANALIKSHGDDVRNWDRPYAVRISSIEAAPTIDPESLRPKGRWEDKYDGKFANPRYRCSVCKEEALYKFERDVLGIYKEMQALTPSCHNCGAKMEG